MSAIPEHSFTCNTCGLSFASADYQREHMKTDWHRYNLKRRVAELPPVPAEVFAEKMLQQSTESATTAAANQSKRQITKKDLKRMEKERLRRAAMSSDDDGSRAHSRASSVVSGISDLSLGEPTQQFVTEDEDEEESDVEPQPAGDEVDAVLRDKLENMVKIPTNVSFMDGKTFDNVEENLAYLESKYGLVVPDSKHLSDVDGFVQYLNEKVGLGNCCLACGYMGRSLPAVRAHMLDKRHVKVPWDTYEEQEELIEFYEFTDDETNGDWEDASDGEIDDDAETAESVTDGPGSQAYIDGYELVLGSGRTAGHRSLQRYYKQHLTAPVEKPGRKAVRLIDNRSQGVSERAAEKMVKDEWSKEIKARRRFNRGRSQQNYQQHFRDQLLQ